MDLGISGKVAFVAGASRGLGKAAAYELAREGAKVAICSRNKQTLEATATEIANATGSEVLPVVADVTRPDQIADAVMTTVSHWKGLHILVTNAGGPPSGKFDDIEDEQWCNAFDLSLMSTVHLVRESLPHLQAAKWGRIIAITSVTVKQPIDDLLLSNVIRPGVVGLVRSLASQLAHENITVNNVAPGYTLTERVEEIVHNRAEKSDLSPEAVMEQMTASMPTGRMGKPEELAAVIAFLASTRASYVTGQTILVDGGSYRGLM